MSFWILHFLRWNKPDLSKIDTIMKYIYIYGAMANKYFLCVVWDLMVASVEL